MVSTEKPSRIARLVSDRIEELKGVKSQKDIAEAVGYKNSNMITMIKLGDAKMALDRVPLFAKALEVNPAFLLRLAMEQFYTPKTTAILLDILGGSASKNEVKILEVIREASENTDPDVTSKIETDLRKLFGSSR